MEAVRTARAEDAEAIATVVAEAFGSERYQAHLTQTQAMVSQAPEEWRLLEHEGRVASACHIAIHGIRVGRCEINKGDVGHVCTLPELQGRGLASELMRDTVAHLKEIHCQIGRLGGLTAFYSRFGWVPFPRRYVEFPIRPVHAGATLLQPTEYLRGPAGFPGEIVPYHPVEHYDARVRLHQELNRGRTGSVVCTFADPPAPGSAEPDPEALRFSCLMEGEVVGYVFAWERPAEVTEFEARIEIGELGFDPGHPEAAGALLARVLRCGAERGVRRATARLPFDSGLEAAMRQAGAPFQWVELHSAPASNMIRIVDPLELFRRITPELEARLARSPVARWRGEIAFLLPGEAPVVLEVRNGRVGAWPWTTGRVRVDLDQAQLLMIVLGLRGFGELLRVETPGDPLLPQAVCEALFPRQPTACGPWG